MAVRGSLAALLLVGACQADGLRTVTGTSIHRYLTDRGEVVVPEDLSTRSVEALVPDDAGGFTVLTGTGLANGTFTIPDVPPGDYYLRIPSAPTRVPQYRVTSESTVDVGMYLQGRPDAAHPTAATDQRFQIDGLEAWRTGDTLQWYSSNADSYLYNVSSSMTSGAPATDATSVDMIVTWTNRAKLVSGSRGDRAYLSQLSRRMSASTPYLSLARAAFIEDTEQTDGLGTNPPIVATMLAPPPAAGLHLDWRRSQFAALFADGSQPQGSLWVSMAPAAYAHHPGGHGRPDVVYIRDEGGGADVDLPDVTYADPYPTTWDRLVSVRYGVGTGFPPDAYYYDVRRLSAVLADPVIEPLIGPPTDLRVDGDLVTWSPPTIGVADQYWVQVSLIDAAFPGSFRTDTLSLTTSDTRARLPPEAFVNGGSFYVSVYALAGAIGSIPESGNAGASAISALLTR